MFISSPGLRKDDAIAEAFRRKWPVLAIASSLHLQASMLCKDDANAKQILYYSLTFAFASSEGRARKEAFDASQGRMIESAFLVLYRYSPRRRNRGNRSYIMARPGDCIVFTKIINQFILHNS